MSRNETTVSPQAAQSPTPGRARQRARTRRAVLDAARRLLREGRVPSVADAAEAAEVSRATAYRYFPSQAALVQAAVLEMFGPLHFDGDNLLDRVCALARVGVEVTGREEPMLRAALRLDLEQRARREAGEDVGALMLRGGRRPTIAAALAPFAGDLDATARRRLEAALAVLVGIEARVVLRDICRLDEGEVGEVVEWAATTLARAVRDGAGAP